MTEQKELIIEYVLPVYNSQNTVVQSIKSLLNQTQKGKVTVINDGSTDNTEELICSMKEFGDFYYDTFPKRLGAAKIRNYANNRSGADIIAVCDADVYYKNRGQAIIEFFEKNPDIDVFSSSLHFRTAENPDNIWVQESHEWDFKSKCNISHPTLAYRREWALKCHYHERTVESDLFEFMLLDMHKKGAKFGYCRNALMLKIEGNTDRDMTKSRQIKKEMYKEYGIEQ